MTLTNRLQNTVAVMEFGLCSKSYISFPLDTLLYTFSHIKNSLDSALSIKLKKYLIYRREIKLHYCKQGKLKF